MVDGAAVSACRLLARCQVLGAVGAAACIEYWGLVFS